MHAFFNSPRMMKRIFAAVFAGACVIGLFDVLWILASLIERRWVGAGAGLLGVLICLGYGGVAWRGIKLMGRLERRARRRMSEEAYDGRSRMR